MLFNEFNTIDKAIKEICHSLDISNNFDINYRTINIGNKLSCLFFIDGFTKDDIMEKLLDYLYGLKPEEVKNNSHDFLRFNLPYIEIDYCEDRELFMTSVLSGMTGLLIDGFTSGILIDCRTYPSRSVEEPLKEKVLRGSRDGFVETIVMNIALIRRRIRDINLTAEITKVGECSKTDIAICYMKDRIDIKLLNRIKNHINSIKTEALTMNQESLAEALLKQEKGRWYWFSRLNPFPKFKYSERPDTAASALLEGHIVLLVDNSPAAMILPTDIFDILEEANDYYFPPVTGNYLRFARGIITIMSFILTPLFLLFMEHKELIPEWLNFIDITDEIHIPIIIQLLILELAIDGLKLAAINTPDMLSTPLSVIAGLVIGEFAVSSGWFNAETCFYMAFVAFAVFTNGSFEMGYAIKLHRILTLILVYFFGVYGFFGGIIICILSILFNQTITETSFLYPLYPLNKKKLWGRLFRH